MTHVVALEQVKLVAVADSALLFGKKKKRRWASGACWRAPRGARVAWRRCWALARFSLSVWGRDPETHLLAIIKGKDTRKAAKALQDLTTARRVASLHVELDDVAAGATRETAFVQRARPSGQHVFRSTAALFTELGVEPWGNLPPTWVSSMLPKWAAFWVHVGDDVGCIVQGSMLNASCTRKACYRGRGHAQGVGL